MTRRKWVLLGFVFLATGVGFLISRKGGPVDGAFAQPTNSSDLTAVRDTTVSEPAAEIVESATPAPEVFNHMQVLVKDEGNRPLEGAEVRLVLRGDSSGDRTTNAFSTSARGLVSVMWPSRTIERCELTASKDGYESRKMIWDLMTGDALPASHTMTLRAGIHVGGFVVDPEGNPVGGATVSLSRFWRGGEERRAKGEEPEFTRQRHTTQVDGRWSARNLPPELLDRIHVEANHTNFIGVMVSMEGKPQIEQELRSGTHKLVLKRGLEVRGRIMDGSERPLSDAKVWAGKKYYRERQETRSDSEGRFHFRNVNEGRVVFSVMADGYAPDSKSVTVGPVTDEVIFKLPRASVIRGIVQNPAGEPIADVRVVLAGNPGDPAYDHYEFSTKTGPDGRFEWASAPNQPMPFYFGKSGYQQRRGLRLAPNEDHVVTMHLNRQVHGQVLDAESGEPVTQFRIAVGRSYSSGFNADSGSQKEFSSPEGFFTAEVHEEESNAIQASGGEYAEQVQSLPTADDGSASVTFRLKRSPVLKGVVLKPDGQPASGAGVALMDEKGRTIMLVNGRLRGSGAQSKVMTADAAGRFSLQSVPEEGSVIAASADGFAAASITQVRSSGVLQLQPYGRIEGILLKAGEPGAGELLALSSPTRGLSYQPDGYRATADANGRFAFENVPPGPVNVVRLIPTSARSWRHSHRAEVVVSAGQTSQVALGGMDATLRGHVRFENPLPEDNLTVTAELTTILPSAPIGLTAEERAAYFKSPEWQEHSRNRKSYSAAVDASGSLLLDSIAPGQYRLRVLAERADDDSFARRPIAEAETTVTVPESVNPNTPIQVGELVLAPKASRAKSIVAP